MENRRTTTCDRTSSFSQSTIDSSELDLKRLNTLLTINGEIAAEKSLYFSEKEKFEAGLLKKPLNSETVFSYFGLMLGSLTPAAIFAKVLFGEGKISVEDSWIVAVLILVNIVAAFTGFISGKFVGRFISHLESDSWIKMLFLLPAVGAFWGIISGGAGGLVFFLFGSIFGAIFGGLVGLFALPFFTVFHRLLKKGDFIERNQFLPLAFGVTIVICAFILGLNP